MYCQDMELRSSSSFELLTEIHDQETIIDFDETKPLTDVRDPVNKLLNHRVPPRKPKKCLVQVSYLL